MLTQGLGWREGGWGEAGLWGVPAMPGVPGCPGRREDSRLAKARFMGGADENEMTRTDSCRCGMCPALHASCSSIANRPVELPHSESAFSQLTFNSMQKDLQKTCSERSRFKQQMQNRDKARWAAPQCS